MTNALIVFAALGLLFPNTRWMAIAAVALLSTNNPCLVWLVVIGAGAFVFSKAKRK